MKQVKQSEDQLQAACVKLFRYQHQPLQWSFFSVPNGGLRNVKVAMKLKSTGALSGVWDMFLSVPKRDKSGMFIEFKVGRNKLTENQISFRNANEEHYHFEVCYTLDEFQKAINNYLTSKT